MTAPDPKTRGRHRDARADSTDARAVRTRRLLVEAFLAAAAERDASPLSVAAVAGTAGVTRAAFYSHFADLDALAVHAISEVFTDIGTTDVAARRTGVGRTAATREAVRRVVAHVEEHRGLYCWVLLRSGGGTAQRVAGLFAESTLRTQLTAAPPPAALDPAVVAQHMAGGFLTVVARWLQGELDLDGDRLVEQLVLLTPWWFLDLPEE